MKPARVPKATPQAPVRVEFQVRFSGGPKCKGPRTPRSAPAPAPVEKASLDQLPKITRLFVLGHHFESLVRAGVVKDYAEIARLTGLSRARVTQIANLTLLAPEIQEAILNRTGITRSSNRITERCIRLIAACTDWGDQSNEWRTQYPLSDGKRYDFSMLSLQTHEVAN